MAGPETALATGRPDLGQLGPITEPAAAPVSATPSADQIAQGQQRASKAYSLDPNYRPSQGQSQRDPIRLKQTGFLGNGQMAQGQASGGDPLFAATMAVPTFEVDQQISNVRKQKAELSDWIAKQGEQFKGKAADPYQPAYEQYVGSEQGKFIKDVADTYFGGDVNKAWKGVYDDPELRAQFDRNNRYLAAIGQANKGGYDYYEKVDKSIVDGNTEVDPETRQLLEDGLNAKWAFNGQGAAHNAAQFDRLNDRLTLNKMFDDFYQPSVKSAGDVTADKWSVEVKNGRKFLVIPSETDYDEFVNSFVEKAMKDGPYRDEAEVRRFVEARVPREKTVKVDPLPLGSGGSAAATPADKVWTSPVQVNMANTNTGGGLVETVSGDGVKRRTPAVQSISVGNVVDGRQEQFSKPVQFKQGNTPVKMIWTGIDRGADGSVMLVGYDPASIDTDTNVDDLNMEIGDLTAKIREDEKYGKLETETEDQFKARLADQKKLRSDLLAKVRSTEKSVQKRMVPLKGNEGVADGLLGGRLQQELSKFGGAPSSTPEVSSQEQYDKLPVGAKYMSGGKEHIKRK